MSSLPPPPPPMSAPPPASGSAAAVSAADNINAAAQPSVAERRSGPNAAATAPPAAVVIALHRHALEGVFAFLELRDLAAALRVARDWLAAVGSMRRLDLAVEQPAVAEPLGAVAQSLMAGHVAALGCSSERLGLDADALALLAHRMAHLRELHCRLQPALAAAPLAFPANLRRLDIVIAQTIDADEINAVAAVIGRLPLLEELSVTLSAMDPQVSFAPLTTLPLLRRLRVWWTGLQVELSDAQVDQLHEMPQLHKLDVPMTTPLLRRLLRQPHDLRWQQISLPSRFDDEAAAVLPQLPSLTLITHSRAACTRFDWLAQLGGLRDVHLRLNSAANTAGRTESLVAGLQCCARVEFLSLSGWADLTAGHLTEMLPRLPRLRELSLDNIPIDSLAFLAQPPLTSQLSRLGLADCPALPLAELRHVHALRGLTALELTNSLTAPLDAESRSLLTPPSAVLPLLAEFCYSEPWSAGRA